jgi:hypothetical protein
MIKLKIFTRKWHQHKIVNTPTILNTLLFQFVILECQESIWPKMPHLKIVVCDYAIKENNFICNLRA